MAKTTIRKNNKKRRMAMSKQKYSSKMNKWDWGAIATLVIFLTLMCPIMTGKPALFGLSYMANALVAFCFICIDLAICALCLCKAIRELPIIT